MNKFLAITALTALSALAFTGCMDDDNGDWKERQQVWPGMSIYNSTMMQQNISMQMAGAVLAVLPLVVMFFIFQKQFIEGVAQSGIKG